MPVQQAYREGVKDDSQIDRFENLAISFNFCKKKKKKVMQNYHVLTNYWISIMLQWRAEELNI